MDVQVHQLSSWRTAVATSCMTLLPFAHSRGGSTSATGLQRTRRRQQQQTAAAARAARRRAAARPRWEDGVVLWQRGMPSSQLQPDLRCPTCMCTTISACFRAAVPWPAAIAPMVSPRAFLPLHCPQVPTQFVHTLNATACAVPRMIVAILENNQQVGRAGAGPGMAATCRLLSFWRLPWWGAVSLSWRWHTCLPCPTPNPARRHTACRRMAAW